MPKAVVTVELDGELHDTFMSEAEAEHRSAAHVIRDLMRDYVRRRGEARGYEDFLRRKVEAARAEIGDGRDRSNEDVEAEFDARRRKLLQAAGPKET